MDKFVRFIVENSHFTILLILIILLYGLGSLYQIQITQDPEIYLPKVQAKFFLPGASPLEMQQNVVFPIESEIRSLNDIVDVKTFIYNGFAESWIEFRYGVDVAKKSQKIESKINNIKRQLPTLLTFNVKEYLVSDNMSAFLLGINSKVDSQEKVYATALDLVSVLEKIKSLKNISVLYPDENIIVSLNITKMRWLGISVEQVTAAIQADNVFSSSGRLQIDDKYFRFNGPSERYNDFEDLKKTVVYSANGIAIRLEDIAQIYIQSQGDRIIGRYNSTPAFFIKVGVNSDANVLSVKDKIQTAVQTFQKTLPATMHIEFIFDQSEGIRHIVFGLLNNFVQGLVILFLVLLFSVGYRSTIIISSLLPLSFLMAIFLFYFTGYGIQQVSIAGFIIALGLIVDNGIVVTENAYLLQYYQGYSKDDAAITGTSAAISPLISSTLTTVLAFAPIFMLTTDVGLYLRSLSVSIWLSLFASLFIATTFVTLLLAKIGTLGTWLRLPNPPSFLILLIPFRDKIYQTVLFYTVKWRWLAILLVLFILGYALYLATKLPVEVFPPTGDPYFTVNATMPANSNEQTKEMVAKKIEETLKQFEAVEKVTTLAGTIFPLLNVSMNNIGDVVILVKTKFGDKSRLNQLLSEVRKALYPLKIHANINLSLFQYQDLSYQSPFSLVLSGNEVNTLKEFAKQIDDQLRFVEGVDFIENPMKSTQMALQLNFLKESAATLGIAKSQIDSFVNMLTYGYEIDRFRNDRGIEFPVLLKIEPAIDDPTAIFREIFIPSVKGGEIPLSEVIKPAFQESESHLKHIMFQPTIEIDVWLKEGFTAEEVATNMLQTVNQIDKPAGVVVEIGGALKGKQQDFQGLGKNAGLIVGLIFAIFVLQFRSFSQPLIVFSAVPLCIIGAILGLTLSGEAMNFLAAIGITSLMGIVVNDSILLVDEGNKLLKEEADKTVKEIAVEAGRKRFMPVLLTSVTTIAGLLPLALGHSIFKAMAIAIIGGLVSSTFLILFLVPVLYSFFSRKNA